MLDTMPQAAPAKHPERVLAILVLAAISYALSQTLVVPALPALASSVHASASSASWVLTGFLLSASVATPIVGKLGDLYGKGRVLSTVMVLFAVGSVVCAFATSIGVIVAGRVIQGVAGGVFPLSFGIIRDTFPPGRVANGIGLLSASFGIGGGIGLPLAGIVVDNLDLSWLFWISLVGLPVAYAVHRLVPPSPPVPQTRVDWLGAIVLSLALAAILYAVTKTGEWGWLGGRTVGLTAAGLLLLGIWLKIESVREQPLIELGVLRDRVVAATNLSGFLVGFAMFSSFLLIPRFAQTPGAAGYGFAMSVTASGLLMAPSAAAQLLAGPIAGPAGRRFGLRLTLAFGSALLAGAFVVMALVHDHPWEFVLGTMLLGAGITFSLAAMANLIVQAVPQSDVGVATGINTIMRTVGGAFGSAGGTAIVAAHVSSSGLPSERGYTVAFLASAAGGALAIGAALLIPRSGHHAGHDRDPSAGADPARSRERLHA
jgi:EmrB/QacA subfamily drug resistance transporter